VGVSDEGGLLVWQYLLDKGANEGVRNKDGLTPALYAAANKEEEEEECRAREDRAAAAGKSKEEEEMKENEINPLEAVKRDFFAAVVAGDVVKVQKMIKGGMHPDAVNGDGETGLVLAVTNGLNASAEALIDSGCNLNAGNKAGETAVTIARCSHAVALVKGQCTRSSAALVALLERHGATPQPSLYITIHTRKSGGGDGSSGGEARVGEQAASSPSPASPPPHRPSTSASEQRPATSSTSICAGTGTGGTNRPSTAASNRPSTAASKRPSAGRMTAADMLKAASGLFSVFDRNKAGEEVRRLEDDIKDAGEVQAKLLRAEHKAGLAREKAEKAHRSTPTARSFTPR
jgi:hypothetical protein